MSSEIDAHRQHVGEFALPERSSINEVNPNPQFGMPQTPSDVLRTMGPAKSNGEQFCGQSRSVFSEDLESSGRPQAASVKLHRRGAGQNRIRHAERQARGCPREQSQRSDKVRPPGGVLICLLQAASLHAQRIARESPIFGNQEKSSRDQESARLASQSSGAPLC
jgi:hypothetical protein